MKTLKDHANDVEDEFGVSGVASGIYEDVWTEAGKRYFASQEAQIAELKAALSTCAYVIEKLGPIAGDGAAKEARAVLAKYA